jgi:hypothetical protein
MKSVSFPSPSRLFKVRPACHGQFLAFMDSRTRQLDQRKELGSCLSRPGSAGLEMVLILLSHTAIFIGPDPKTARPRQPARELTRIISLLTQRLLPPMTYKFTLVLGSINVWGSYILVVPVTFPKQVILV